MSTTDDLLNLLAQLDAPPDPSPATRVRDSHIVTDVATSWLVEHLTFTVPWCVAHLDRYARSAPPISDWDLTYADHVRRRLAQIGRDLGGLAGGREPQQSISTVIGALGDALMGESRTGRGHAVAMAAAWGLAGVALVCDEGASFAGLHWCTTHCAQALRKTQDDTLAQTDPPSWWAPLDELETITKEAAA